MAKYIPEQLPEIAEFINQRTEYIQMLRNTSMSDYDYHLWHGYASASRQLAESLGWTVPLEPGEKTRVKQ